MTMSPKAEAKARRKTKPRNGFRRVWRLEETGAPVDQALEAYSQAIALNPECRGRAGESGHHSRSARANCAMRRNYYQRAIEADPRYPLAHFNLGNVFDEMGKT